MHHRRPHSLRYSNPREKAEAPFSFAPIRKFDISIGDPYFGQASKTKATIRKYDKNRPLYAVGAGYLGDVYLGYSDAEAMEMYDHYIALTHSREIPDDYQLMVVTLRENGLILFQYNTETNLETAYDYSDGARSESRPVGKDRLYPNTKPEKKRLSSRKNNPRHPINVVALKALHKQFEKLVIQEFGNSGPEDDDEDALVEYQTATDALISLDTIIDMINSGEPQHKIDSEIQSFYQTGEADSASMYINIKKALPRP
jgi:hypothetical protein